MKDVAVLIGFHGITKAKHSKLVILPIYWTSSDLIGLVLDFNAQIKSAKYFHWKMNENYFYKHINIFSKSRDRKVKSNQMWLSSISYGLLFQNTVIQINTSLLLVWYFTISYFYFKLTVSFYQSEKKNEFNSLRIFNKISIFSLISCALASCESLALLHAKTPSLYKQTRQNKIMKLWEDITKYRCRSAPFSVNISLSTKGWHW